MPKQIQTSTVIDPNLEFLKKFLRDYKPGETTFVETASGGSGQLFMCSPADNAADAGMTMMSSPSVHVFRSTELEEEIVVKFSKELLATKSEPNVVQVHYWPEGCQDKFRIKPWEHKTFDEPCEYGYITVWEDPEDPGYFEWMKGDVCTLIDVIVGNYLDEKLAKLLLLGDDSSSGEPVLTMPMMMVRHAEMMIGWHPLEDMVLDIVEDAEQLLDAAVNNNNTEEIAG